MTDRVNKNGLQVDAALAAFILDDEHGADVGVEHHVDDGLRAPGAARLAVALYAQGSLVFGDDD